MKTTTSPFSLITEPTACRRIVLLHGLSDMPETIRNFGFAFAAIETDEHHCLVICSKAPSGATDYRIVTAEKRIPAKLISATWAAIIESLTSGLPFDGHLEQLERNRN